MTNLIFKTIFFIIYMNAAIENIAVSIFIMFTFLYILFISMFSVVILNIKAKA